MTYLKHKKKRYGKKRTKPQNGFALLFKAFSWDL
jgi:hypothetical protein